MKHNNKITYHARGSADIIIILNYDFLGSLDTYLGVIFFFVLYAKSAKTSAKTLALNLSSSCFHEKNGRTIKFSKLNA